MDTTSKITTAGLATKATNGLDIGSKVRRSLRYLTLGGSVALLLWIIWLITAIFAPLISPFEPTDTDLANRLAPPLAEATNGGIHLLGTDELGRDILTRLIYGSRVSLMVAMLAVPISVFIGVLFGVSAGYVGGKFETAVMRLLDVQLALPFILLALAVLVAIGPGFRNIVILLGITGWTHYARIIRAQTLSLKERDFVLAATAMGARSGRVIFRHLLPSTLSMMIVLVTLQIPSVIVSEASLSFLGLGIQPPSPSWGGMLSSSRMYLFSSWWLPLFPGICITLAALSGNLLGDWINDLRNPR